MAGRPGFTLEIGRWGEDWHEHAVPITRPEDFHNLDVFKDAAREFIEDFPQYEARVLNEKKQIIAHLIHAVDMPVIDIKASGADWIDRIREGYGLPGDTFARAVREWLAANPDA
jgi:ABC-type proline/glycine betaine transport system substrate-binding protein